jgi:hypothetical protein
MRRVIEKLVIEEISAVDRPTQEHARAVIRKRDDTMEVSNIDTQQLAHEACLLKAAELRKSNPKLTPEQAYARVYESNIEIRKGDRYGAVLNFQKFSPSVARTTPITEFGNSNSTGLAALEKLAAELRERNPFLTVEQAFAKVYADPANRELASAERAAAYERMYSTDVRTMA